MIKSYSDKMSKEPKINWNVYNLNGCDEFDKERVELYKQISESIWPQKTIEWEMDN